MAGAGRPAGWGNCTVLNSEVDWCKVMQSTLGGGLLWCNSCCYSKYFSLGKYKAVRHTYVIALQLLIWVHNLYIVHVWVTSSVTSTTPFIESIYSLGWRVAVILLSWFVIRHAVCMSHMCSWWILMMLLNTVLMKFELPPDASTWL